MTPTTFGDPGKMSDPQFFCVSDGATNPNGDGGGVHFNSGVPNHAFALMVDGGTYNGRTITGIGLAKSGLIQYRALTAYLTSGFDDSAVLTLDGRGGPFSGTSWSARGDSFDPLDEEPYSNSLGCFAYPQHRLLIGYPILTS